MHSNSIKYIFSTFSINKWQYIKQWELPVNGKLVSYHILKLTVQKLKCKYFVMKIKLIIPIMPMIFLLRKL